MLKEHDVPFRYREYRKDPLSVDEIETLLAKLGLKPHEVWRKRDRASRELGLDGTESDSELVALMAEHPTLLERPIGVLGERAVVGRPVERLLALAGD